MSPNSKIHRLSRSAGIAIALATPGGCTVGPNYVSSAPDAPQDWTSWRSADPSLLAPANADVVMPTDWWTAFKDPVLDDLVSQALAASPDLETAALHFAQARVQRSGTASAALPQVGASADVSRQRQSEYGAGTRLFDAIGSDRDALAKLLSQPFTLFRGGFDASWEIDLWGKVRRSIEAADATVAQKGALLDQARLSVASEVASTYFDLRTSQRDIALLREDIALLRDRISLVKARVEGGIDSHGDLDREDAALQGMEARLPATLAKEAAQANAIGLLLGKPPGSLKEKLAPRGNDVVQLPPDLSLGLPSEVALRRPDVRAAEAGLHAATARIGVAVADLYPSIRLGGGFGLESYRSQNLFDWASRNWSIGPSLDLPLFDGGRRRSVVKLRKLEQREAAVAFQTTVLKSWQEIDNALNRSTAARQEHESLTRKVGATQSSLAIAQASYESGAINYLGLIEAKRALIQARRELSENEGLLRASYVAVNKAIGNTPENPLVQNVAQR
ncbi:efflux transporter outer membrane subunit [Novosphingobium mathurense]|uniref:Efflux transporter, outer membrane factor (OMF) lipoprotein, NodT family n=1 Tax=Novosphingobium mathurense TaxID=428990 RepID=A0A1U6GYZ0_9SPHN|nr:efflux transporter outer membrane subunit [Novosphingobium mathurense]SLJ88650.1 efflux transporter, outer membrane factor (OMF) lipoprotein, NodT family [Novosphingobium mathurense]